MPELIQVSVRELVEFVFRSGDLSAPFVSAARAVAGTRAHQLVQSSRPEDYESEVAVGIVHEGEPLSLEINGRVDGLVRRGDELLIEEIKSTSRAPDPGREDNPVHWAQVKIYGYILGVQNQLEVVQIQLTYVQLGSGALLEDRRNFSIEELSGFFHLVVARYLRWASAYHSWCQERDQSVAALRFPFPEMRAGQQELQTTVGETIDAGATLYAQAPTGIGKTISVLFPATKALGRRCIEKIFFLTAKTSGRMAAEKAFEDLRAVGLKIKSLTLTARDRVCFNARDGLPCDRDTCEFAIGYYDRLNDALEDLFQRDALTRPVVEEVARRHRVCPFELSLDISEHCDSIICDYNYVFDPRVYLKRYFAEGTGGGYAFLVDEAHNLVDRAREMYSAELHKADVLRTTKALGDGHSTLTRILENLNRYLLAQQKRCETEGDGESLLERELPTELLPLLQRFLEEAEPVLSARQASEATDLLRDLYFAAFGFLRVAELFDEHYITYAEKSSRDLRLRLFCLDPSDQIRQALKRGAATTFFSATLTPIEYYRDLLGGALGDFNLALPSPFPTRNLRVVLADHVDTTYRQRHLYYDEVAASIAAASQSKVGNYIAYFPSYKYLEQVHARFLALNPEVFTVCQHSRMSEAQKEDFLTLFGADNERTVIGFAVMGGIFGEGIDLVGERLVGAIVVGVGLPQICLERNLIRSYYDEKGTSGFSYAYAFPGMNRVLQAAGRVIRSAQDRGIIVLIDSRFAQSSYLELLPAHWSDLHRVDSAAHIRQAVAAFWVSE
jgi:DNA excision repair protein ERCC-2